MPLQYRAFISYSSSDRVIGERFQRAIEHYRIPRALRGQRYGDRPVPARLTPLFRDRSDADAGANLADTLREALERSESLVVLCSPAAARSRWVNDEIRTFKALGRGHRIVPVIVDGAPRRYVPGAAEDGAFPPALFERLDASGTVIADDGPEPLAADVRPAGDGFNMARLKVIAALTDIPLTILTQRQLEAERREKRIVRAVALAMTCLAGAASAAAVWAWRSQAKAAAALERAIAMNGGRVDEGTRFLEAYGVPVAVIRELLSRAEDDFAALVGRDDTGVPNLELQRGRVLMLFSQLYRALGESERQLALAREAREVVERIRPERGVLRPATWFAEIPDEGAVRTQRLAALENLGVALTDAGESEEAQRVLEAGRALAEQADDREMTAQFWARLGELHYLDGDLQRALDASQAAVAALETLARERPDPDLAVALALARSDTAEVLLESERTREALAEQAAALEAIEAHATAKPDDTDALRSLGHALNRHGAMTYAHTGTWKEAVPQFTRALEIFERLHATDPGRADFARELSIALEQLADVMLQTNEVARAAPLLDRSLALRRERSLRDPSNPEAQRDLAVALERQADVAVARGEPARALVLLDEARMLREPAAADGTDPVAVRDLAILWSRTGAARHAAGRREWAAAFDTAIELMSKLTAADGAPPGWLRDLAVFRYSYGEALARAGRHADARRQWSAALDLVEQQLRANPDDPRLLEDRTILRRRLG